MYLQRLTSSIEARLQTEAVVKFRAWHLSSSSRRMLQTDCRATQNSAAQPAQDSVVPSSTPVVPPT